VTDVVTADTRAIERVVIRTALKKMTRTTVKTLMATTTSTRVMP
jgi:hypothetical protein